ncbi:ferredoxin:protochlorophyllide reductase (ATP-dependent) iron-sulfur ATP-binding protein [Heliophilum fasciatum]|uniref:Light-independent protochlorophyllide reductase iron-sulfur ATP-binding protein n=1 Tax=Heliophilum fasciatum TaxID=35700 RepID=A0A4R2RVI9_9FIRM|nr:ferredoxin:protochlorophyllide reductase (ATP-dependent) iron-sulfur ATP-binding protein [Heliophilum fasciatum]MCW2277052.1 light-independent protochlorophyllide reductase subunit L [Heliophilum fasciatum]TCP68422.1 ferredoxin protochlorophyllide reductase subunit L [Heliophilum fasciatum]
MIIAVYGKGGVGKSTVTSNLAVAMAKLGKKVLQIGCDPKSDSTFTIAGRMIPTVVEILDAHNYHYESIEPENLVVAGYAGVHVVETGGPPAGSGCGGYVVGETVKLLERLDLMTSYDIILFDVLGDVVCGGFATPLQYADLACVVSSNDFDALFAANRICESIVEKNASGYDVKFAGVIGNRCDQTELLETFTRRTESPLLGVVPRAETIRQSRVQGFTVFELEDMGEPVQELTTEFKRIAAHLISKPPGVIPDVVGTREMFELFRGEDLPWKRSAAKADASIPSAQ